VAEVVLMGDPRVAAIPVNECGEELVDTRDHALDSDPDENPQNTVYAFLRRSVAQRLLQAQGALPAGLRILLAEGYRPYEQQELYFNRRKQCLVDADPTLTDDDAFLRASEFVSPPEIAPHVAGAAVDLTLVDERGQALDMGTAIDARPEDCDGACYIDAANISAEARGNRGTLAAALSGAGFVNYPTEWWHWSYGDRYWALLAERPCAIFGPVHMRTEAPRHLW
jgi:zinc D-Ala-D-Ala dipeptidase